MNMKSLLLLLCIINQLKNALPKKLRLEFKRNIKLSYGNDVSYKKSQVSTHKVHFCIITPALRKVGKY